MAKNAQLHLFLESNLLEALKRQAEDNNISISELCRQKLRECSQLTKIEMILEQLNRKLSKECKK